jgi:transcriptional regulator with XRE-family HTH domain
METELTAWLQRYRLAKGWTVRQMAEKMELSSSGFDAIIKGEVAIPERESLRKIATHTHYPLDQLLVMAGYRDQDAPSGDPDADALIALVQQLPLERRGLLTVHYLGLCESWGGYQKMPCQM